MKRLPLVVTGASHVASSGPVNAASELMTCQCGGKNIYVMRCAVMCSRPGSPFAAHMSRWHVPEKNSYYCRRGFAGLCATWREKGDEGDSGVIQRRMRYGAAKKWSSG